MRRHITFAWSLLTVCCLLLSSFTVLASQQKTPVMVWVFPMGDGTRTLYDEVIIPEFEKQNPDIELTIVLHPWTARDEKMILGFISGSGPDIAYLNLDFFRGFIAQGMLEPLDRYLTEEDKQDFMPSALNAMTFDGQLWGFPIIQSAIIPMINTTAFEETGMDPGKPPSNWEELESAAVKLTRLSDNPARSRYGLQWSQGATTTNVSFNPFLWSAGGDIFAPDGRSVIWDQEPGIEALDYLANLHRLGVVGGNFASGTAAIRFGNDAALGMTLSKQIVPFEWAPGVVIGHKQRVTYGTVAGYAMFSNSKNKEAAARVLRFLTSKEMMTAQVTTWGYLGPRRSIRASDYGENAGWFVKFFEGAPYTRPDITHPLVRDIYKFLAPAVQRAVKLTETPLAALQVSAQQANQFLRENMK
ncbi:MAG TPA: sugar ABC transporter substrate-binding protein [Firmicutes bacterium]|nr:sugar ABC transporter substrate-binding protein [Bacillota bacterium]